MKVKDFFKFSDFSKNLAIVNAVGIDSWHKKSFSHASIIALPFILLIAKFLSGQNYLLIFLFIAVSIFLTHSILRKWANKAKARYSHTISQYYDRIVMVYNYYLLIYFAIIGLVFLFLTYT